MGNGGSSSSILKAYKMPSGAIPSLKPSLPKDTLSMLKSLTYSAGLKDTLNTFRTTTKIYCYLLFLIQYWLLPISVDI